MCCVDELSAGSSPGLRRAAGAGGGTLTPSSGGGSRNQSPRPRDTGEARLRPGVTSRSSNNRNSANLNSTLQEDLIKLINPDYMVDDNIPTKVCNCHLFYFCYYIYILAV